MMALIKKHSPVWAGFLLAFFIFGFAGCGPSTQQIPLKPGGLVVGDKALDFALTDSQGQIMKLSDMKPGWYLVLVLYRGYWCSACLNQLLNLKEDFAKFPAVHAAVAAVSVDKVEDSYNFNQQWRFPFPLLADPNFQVIDAYGARHPSGHDGHDIARPTVIIIDPQKIVRYKYLGKDPMDRPTDNEILFQIQQMQKAQGNP
jgi:peroxiredoxin Q/BCP